MIDWYSVAEVAEKLGVSRKTLTRWRQAGKGPQWVQIGGRIRYPAALLEEYVAQGEAR